MSEVTREKNQVDDKKIAKLPIVGPRPKNEREEQYLREVCEYEFFNLEEPGLAVKFPYGNTDNSHTFVLFHGGKYHLPRHVARHLESCSTPLWDWRPDGLGKMVKQRIGEKSRFQLRHVFA